MRSSVEDYLENERLKEPLGDFTLSEYNEKGKVYRGRHLFPSVKLTFSSQWLSQDISLFLHEISLSLQISVHKSLSLFNF